MLIMVGARPRVRAWVRVWARVRAWVRARVRARGWAMVRSRLGFHSFLISIGAYA